MQKVGEHGRRVIWRQGGAEQEDDEYRPLLGRAPLRRLPRFAPNVAGAGPRSPIAGAVGIYLEVTSSCLLSCLDTAQAMQPAYASTS